MMKLPGRITSGKLLKADIITAAILAICLFALNYLCTWADGLFEADITLSNAYIALTDSSGNSYVVDEEHARILKLDTEKRVVFSITENTKEADTISYVGDMAVDDDGYLYVVEDHWGGLYLDREAILVYNSDGKYETTVYDDDFGGAYVDKRQVLGLTIYDGKLWFAVLGSDSIQITIMDTSTYEMSVYTELEYENAFNAVYDMAILPENKTIYLLDKRGEVVRISGGVQEVIYSTADDPDRVGGTALYMMAADSEENIYLTDIKGNYIYKLDKEDNSINVILSGDTALSVSVSDLAGGSTILSSIYGGQLYETDTDGTILWQGDSFERSDALMAMTVAIYILMLAGLLASLWLAVRIVVFLATRHYSDQTKSSLVLSATVVVVVAIIVVQLMSSFREVYTDEMFEKLYLSARSVSSELDPEVVDAVNDPEDFMGDAYNTLIAELERLLDRSFEYNQTIYCNILKYADGEAWSVAYLDQSTGCYYPLDEVETAEVREVYETGCEMQNGGKADVSGSYAYVKVPIFNEDGNVVAVVAVGSDTYIIEENISSMQGSVLITLVTTVLILLFLFGEGLGFMDLRSKYKQKLGQHAGAAPVPMHMIRVITCVTFFAFNMSTSFLSAYAARLVIGGTGLWGSLAASLPITLNLAFMGIMSLFCAPLMARFSFRKIAVISTAICFCGDMTVFISGNYPGLMAGLILNGIGVGLITNCVSLFIVGSDDADVKRDGLTVFNSGSVSGINIGSMVGASVAGILGQRFVFAVSSVVWIIVALLFLSFGQYMERTPQKNQRPAADEISRTNGKSARFRRFISSPSMWGYMLCIQVPYIMLNSFVYYYVPIYGDAQGYSENVTCLLLMIHSLCSVFFGVSISNFAIKRFGDRTVYLSTAMSLAGLLLFAANPGIVTLMCTLLIMGISTSFGVSAKGVYFTELPKVKEYGEEESMGIYNLSDNVGESFGPMIFGPLMASGNLLSSMLKFTGTIFGMGAIYAVSSIRPSKRKEKEA